MATKRIPRKNLPPLALPEWNRQWLSAVADRVAVTSYSDYLHQATLLLRKLARTLEGFLDDWFRKAKVSNVHCDALNEVNEGAKALTPPAISAQAAAGSGSAEKHEVVTNLQNVLFSCSVNLITRFNKLPVGANAYISWTGNILKHIDSAIDEEPWHLLADRPPEELKHLRQIVEGLRLMAGESGLRNTHPLRVWHKPSAQRKTAFRLAAEDARQTVSRRLTKVKAEIKKTLGDNHPEICVYVREKADDIAPWPPAKVLFTIPIKDFSDWFEILEQNAEKFRAAVGSFRQMTLVPLVHGIAVDRLTVGGVDTLFPLENTAHDWLKQEGIKVLDDACARAFSAVSGPLAEISGINQYGYGINDRPLVEQEALSNNYTKLQSALVNLRSILIEETDLLDLIESYVEQVISNQVFLARDISTFCLPNNDHPSWFEISTAINLKLIELDLETARRMQ